MWRYLFIFPMLAVAACAGTPATDLSKRRTITAIDLPPIKTFAAQETPLPQKNNAALARDFLELSFKMESGRQLPTFTRFEGPITVRMVGALPNAIADRDLDALLARMRREASLPISRVRPDEAANITVEAISRATLQRVVPNAACFVVPNVSSWEEFRRNKRSNTLDWARLKTRTRAAIFLPGDVALQEIRDCLHEELAQALGPLNDLYRLSDSVFNDDNFHTVLTGFDMLMLRVTYSPLLKSGMTQAEVTNILPRILDALNPAGRNAGIAAPIETPRAWIDAIETALGSKASSSRRLHAAEDALMIAQQNGWSDTRMAFSLFVMARLSLNQESDLALATFFRASALYGSSDSTALQSAHVGMQLAAYALSSGDGNATVDIINGHLGVVRRAENAALLSTLLLMKAEALTMMGQNADAAIVRQDGLGWARYGFGTDAEVGERLNEIAALRPIG